MKNNEKENVNILQDVAGRIKHVRKEKGMTRKEFAEALETMESVIDLIENGSCTPPESLVDKLEEVFSVSTTWLYSGIGKPFLTEREMNELKAMELVITTLDEVPERTKALFRLLNFVAYANNEQLDKGMKMLEK